MTRQPAAIFIVDILKEHIALAEARRLNIPTFAMVDTNSNPKLVDFPIPSNDDASKSISMIMDEVCSAIQEGLEERKFLKDNPEKAKAKEEAPKLKPKRKLQKLKPKRKLQKLKSKKKLQKLKPKRKLQKLKPKKKLQKLKPKKKLQKLKQKDRKKACC